MEKVSNHPILYFLESVYNAHADALAQHISSNGGGGLSSRTFGDSVFYNKRRTKPLGFSVARVARVARAAPSRKNQEI